MRQQLADPPSRICWEPLQHIAQIRLRIVPFIGTEWTRLVIRGGAFAHRVRRILHRYRCFLAVSTPDRNACALGALQQFPAPARSDARPARGPVRFRDRLQHR
jgi:hypothetical protein